MAKVSFEKFVELARKSELVEAEQVTDIVARMDQQGAKPSEPEQLAERMVAEGLITRWQSENLLKGKHKGFFIKKYKLLDHLGTGGMSTVYLARHVLMQRQVAIKVLPKRRIDDSSYLARFYLEAQAAAALDHPNIVRAYDIDNDGDVHFLVMEYVEGRDLNTIVNKDGPLGYVLAAEYIRQAAEGLAHAHEAGLVHRDVKPANLLVDTKGVVKLLDMGLARFNDEGRMSLTMAHEENVLGTADYLSPEQAINSHSVDARADVYSLGCSLYFLLTGHPPFNEGTLAQRLIAHQKKAPPSIFQDRSDAPLDLINLCTRMMVKDPNGRLQSCRQVIAELTKWLQSQGQDVTGGSSSGISGGSSIKMAVAMADPAFAEAAAGSTRRAERRGSSPPKLPRSRRAGTADTRSGSDRPTERVRNPSAAPGTKGDDSKRPPRLPGGGGSGVGSKSGKLRRAQPLQNKPLSSTDEFPEFSIDTRSPIAVRPAANAKPGEGHASGANPVVRPGSKSPPLWIWIAIGAGGLMALVLLILLLLLM